ncbi:meiosis-specific kinetochore protein isoform X1 [Meles meles]|uniref:meiosis-specific kinetochore protein isoform X1 n=1 Tax=Meles meles TaxID=9662 RepID=UPI001E69EEDE|nr:meiosis-specific kinetochore protein isoform X1 [Meles meles]
MWSLRVYTSKKRAGQRLNLTPTLDLGPTAKVEAPPGPGRRHSAHRLKGKARHLQKISEKAECTAQGVSGSRPPSGQLRVTGQKSLHENSTNEEPPDEKVAPLSESVTDDLQVDCSSSNSELVSGLSLQHGISSSLLSYSFTDSYTEHKSFGESLSSFSSPELFRGSESLDWECPKLEEHTRCKNSTLLDTSTAVAIEKVPQFSNLSAILGMSSEDHQKCQREIVMTLADQNISSKPKSTTHSESDNAACKVLLAEKTYPSAPEKTKKKPEKDPEPSNTYFQTKLSSPQVKIKVPSSRSITKVPLSQPQEPAWRTNSSIPDKKSRGLLTSTPSSQTAGLVIDLSSVQRTSFEELFPNVSNYVNSNEIVPVSNLQECSSNEIPSETSEICCIIRATPGTRQMKSKSNVIIKKKKYSPPKDIPQDIIIKTNGRM